jgi:hypothetical protein
MRNPHLTVANVKAVCRVIVLLLLLAMPGALLAQTPDDGTPIFPFDSPLIMPLPTATSTATLTATPTLTPTPTPDFSSAVLQVSPLRVAPDDRPINTTNAMLWLVAALTLVFAGAIVMAVKK